MIQIWNLQREFTMQPERMTPGAGTISNAIFTTTSRLHRLANVSGRSVYQRVPKLIVSLGPVQDKIRRSKDRNRPVDIRQ